jgi:hypothetical protein
MLLTIECRNDNGVGWTLFPALCYDSSSLVLKWRYLFSVYIYIYILFLWIEEMLEDMCDAPIQQN